MNASGHPQLQELSSYVSGTLPESDASVVAQHLAECPTCESTVQQIEAKSDTMLSGLRGKPPAEPYLNETEYRRAAQNAAAIAGTAGAGAAKPAAAAKDPQPSTKAPSPQLGPYKLLAKLGEGGMGAVFKAQHEHLEKLVAIKVLPKAAMNDKAAVDRFRREMKAVGRLHHPNIVTAHDAGEARGVHFLVMEYVEGSDLSSLVKKQGPLKVDVAVAYVLQAARGLEFAHAKGIVHRDIKPANLLVDGEGTVKILDMGLARLDGDAATKDAKDGLTQTGQVMGTVDYMAPEQAFDTHRADGKADVYSLGCTLYRLVTGKNAFDGDTLVQKILAHRENPIPSLGATRVETPAALDSLYQRMMAKRPDDRPTMAEVVRELEAIQWRGSTIGVAETIGGGILGASTATDDGLAKSVVLDLSVSSKPTRAPISPAKKPAPAGKGGRRNKPPLKLIMAGFGGFAMILGGVLLYIGNTKIEVPEGATASVEVDPSGKPNVRITLPTATPSTAAPSTVAAASPRSTPPLPTTKPAPAAGSPSTPNGPVEFQGKRYQAFRDVLSWHAARDRCIAEDGHLAIVRSPAEQAFLIGLLKSARMDAAWIGATDEQQEGDWVWVDGSKCNFKDWDQYQPNNKPPGEHYAAIVVNFQGRPHNGRWSDQPAVATGEHPTIGFICQWDAASSAQPVAIPQSANDLFARLTDDTKWQWSEPENLGPVNTAAGDYAPTISGDTKVLVFHSARPDSLDGKWDLYISQRSRLDEPFPPAVNLGPAVNSAEEDHSPSLSEDGLRLIFISRRSANGDIYETTRASRDEPFGPARLLAGGVNTLSTEASCAVSADGRVVVVSSTEGAASEDLYQTSRPDLKASFGKRSPVSGRNGRQTERHPWISGDGRVLVYNELGGPDTGAQAPTKIWAAVRTAVDQAFGPRREVSISRENFTSDVLHPSFSADGGYVVFSTTTAGAKYPDLWMSRRVRKDGGATPVASGAQAAPAGEMQIPGFQAWLTATKALPADKQLVAVSQKLMELNPGFDGKFVNAGGGPMSRIENGVVTEVGFLTTNVTNVAPVRALPGLRKLWCCGHQPGTGPIGKLVDLGPLAGLPLVDLTVHYNRIQDLSPLRGMPLIWIGLTDTRCIDLEALRGMPLEKVSLNYCHTVRDFSPLRGMRLTNLGANGTQIADLSVLEGMPLEGLQIANTKVTDLAPLSALPLTFLDLGSNTPIASLTPLHQCKRLHTLLINNNKIDPAQIEALQTALPHCKIEYSAPADAAVVTAALKETDPERRVAMWVLGRGGKPRIRCADGEAKNVNGVEDLPAEPFYVTSFKIGGIQKPITEDEWRALGELRAVENVDVSGCRPSDEALKALGRCQSLRYLVLASDDSFGDEGVMHLSNLPRLAYLDLCNSGITAASLEHLGKITSLRSLKLGLLKNMQVTSLKPLQSLVNLEYLGLNRTMLTDAAVGDLAALPRLRFLNLTDTRCTPAVVDEILKLRGLYTLSLEGVRAGAVALRKLADHPTLSVVYTYGGGITVEEYGSLRTALPRITIVHPELQTAYAEDLAVFDWADEVGTISGYDAALRTADAPFMLETKFTFAKSVVPEDLRRLAKLKNLNSLVLTPECTSDEHLLILFEALREYPHLGELIIYGPKLTDGASLAGLARHSGLTSLHIARSDRPGDDALAPLANMPELVTLRLESTALTDAVFAHLTALPRLRVLQLNSARVTGARLGELASLPQLQHLDLSGSGVTDAALAALAEAERLDRLDLSETRVTDAGMRHLAVCRSLRQLFVQKTQVTPAGIAALRKDLPECLIFSDSGSLSPLPPSSRQSPEK